MPPYVADTRRDDAPAMLDLFVPFSAFSGEGNLHQSYPSS